MKKKLAIYLLGLFLGVFSFTGCLTFITIEGPRNPPPRKEHHVRRKKPKPKPPFPPPFPPPPPPPPRH